MQNIYGQHHSAKIKTCSIDTLWNNQLPHLTNLAIFLSFSSEQHCLFLLYEISTGGQSQLFKPGRIMQRWRGDAVKCLVRSQKMAAQWSEKMAWQNLGKMVWLDGGAQWLGCPPASQLRLGRPIPNICAWMCDLICAYWNKHQVQHQGGRSCMNLRTALAEKFGLGRQYFVAILRFVAIYAFYKAFIEP